jgi:hypothetical protein
MEREERKKHIMNLLKEAMKGGPNPGEGLPQYLDRMAETILSYVPKEEKKKKKFGDGPNEIPH